MLNYKNWQTIKLPNCKIAKFATDSCLELCHQQSFLRKLLDWPSCSCAATATTMMIIIARSFKEWPRWASFPFREFPPPNFFSFAKKIQNLGHVAKKLQFNFYFAFASFNVFCSGSSALKVILSIVLHRFVFHHSFDDKFILRTVVAVQVAEEMAFKNQGSNPTGNCVSSLLPVLSPQSSAT